MDRRVDKHRKGTPLDGPNFATMGRRKIRTVITVTLGLFACYLLVIYVWPANLGDDVVQEVPAAVDPTSWWWSSLLRRKAKARCREKVVVSSRDSEEEDVIDTNKMYGSLEFQVKPGTRSYWNKTFEERYLRWKETRSKDLPLEVIVVPNSHIDPGWLRTYDEYYNGQVVPILDNMLSFLDKTPEFTFIWSEISYFSMWWKDLNPKEKETLKKILRRRQLEIVTGGWVMVDEATSHYWAMIDQMVEGQQFLSHVDASALPSYAWSVDVFGHSSTMPSLLSAAGMKGMVVLRVHYSWRTLLAASRKLDFLWDTGSNSAISCHMAPSDLYSIKHACGPNPSACLQFDFRNIPMEYSESISIASAISKENVEPKAELLLGQYERYASLYPHNVLLVPLGDDFRYDRAVEWDQQYQNYKKLFDFINGKHSDVRVRFGTLADYFEEVAKRSTRHPELPKPLIRGDFLPYADVYADGSPSYWTGFYSSRPFAKALARELEHWLRTAEILYSYSLQCARGKDRKLAISDYSQLMSARHSLALFHHHDAITGTSKYFVMDDYIRRLHAAVVEAMTVVTHAAQHILMSPTGKDVPRTSRIFLDSVRHHPEMMTVKTAVKATPKGREIVVFNSLTFRRREIVKVKVAALHVEVLDDSGRKVDFQINPVWNATANMMSTEYELLFVCDVGALSFKTYTVALVSKDEWDPSTKADVTIYIADKEVVEFKSETDSLVVKFNSKGLPKEIYSKNQHVNHRVGVDFFAYNSKPYVSGAYLFNPYPTGPVPLSQISKIHPITRIVVGRLVSEATFSQSSFPTVTTRVHHYEGSPEFVELDTTFDISKMVPGIELVMRISTDIKNEGVFHTDSNGLNMFPRKRVDELPVQGNYYPMTSAAYIEDAESRMTLLSGQTHGLTSPSDGVVEVMLDRRIMHDDLRGLSEGVLDNKPTSAKFRFVLEPSVGSAASELTQTALVASRTLLYPLVNLIVDSSETVLLSDRLSLSPKPWPFDAHLVTLKTLASPTDFYHPGNRSLLIVLNDDIACENQQSSFRDLDRKVINSNYLVNVTSIERTSLTGVLPPSGHGKLTAYSVSLSAG